MSRRETDLNVLSGQSLKSKPKAEDYVRISEQTNPIDETFNKRVQKTRIIKVSGYQLVFDSSVETGGNLFKLCNNKTDIKELHLYADEIIIRSHLQVYQSLVRIHARKLTFQGDEAAIVSVGSGAFTGPDPSPTKPGDDGSHAGDIHVYVQEIDASPTGRTRLSLWGRKGQKGGDGLEGAHAKTMARYPLDIATVSYGGTWKVANYFKGGGDDLRKHAVYVEYWMANTSDGKTITPEHSMAAENNRQHYEPPPSGIGPGYYWHSNFTTHWGEDSFPGDGQPSKPAGKPGDGGNGGNLFTNALGQINDNCTVSLSGGAPGDPGKAAKGGKKANPAKAFKVQMLLYRWNLDFSSGMKPIITEVQHSKDGKSLPSPTAQQGKHGKIEEVSKSWLHPNLLRVVLQFSRDLYLANYFEEAKHLLETYSITLEKSLDNVESDDDKLAFETNRGEIQTLLYRLNANLDYFGHPAGWVPMLSFEANQSVYEKETKDSIPVLFLAYWIKEKGKELTRKGNFLDYAIQNLQKENKALEKEFNEALSSLPGLQSEINAVVRELEQCEKDLESRQALLLKQAEGDVKLRHEIIFAIKTIGIIAQVLPVGQPALGAVGKGLDILADIDPEEPFKSGGKLGEVLKEYNKEKLKSKADNAAETVSKGSDEKNNAKAKAAALIAQGKKFAPVLKSLNQALKDLNAPQSEIDARLNDLMAKNPACMENIAEVKRLTPIKAALFQKMQKTLQMLTDSYNKIASNLLAIDQLNVDVNRVDLQLDHNVILYAQEMEQRAKERLALYEYYVKKAYEYRIIKAYDYKGYTLGNLMGKMGDMITGTDSGILTEDQYRQLAAVYRDHLQEITRKLVTELNEDGVETQFDFNICELRQHEIDALNAGKTVEINLVERLKIPYSMENVRISDLGIRTSVDNPNAPTGIEAEYDEKVRDVTFHFEHSGRSILRSKGKLYLFDNTSLLNERSMSWGAKFMPQSKRLSNSKPSEASNSFFNKLLGVNNEQGVLKYSRPSAWANIRIDREYESEGKFKITKLILQYKLDFKYAPKGNRVLDMRLPESLSPRIEFSKKDLNDRSNTNESAFRIYGGGEVIALTAPKEYEDASFIMWKMLDQHSNGEIEEFRTNVLKISMPFDEFYYCRVAPVYKLKNGASVTVNLHTGETESIKDLSKNQSIPEITEDVCSA